VLSLNFTNILVNIDDLVVCLVSPVFRFW